LQCYRCLHYEHMAAACQFENGLAGRCFRCGGSGHVAQGCTAEVRCPLCHSEGKEAGHRMGGRACKVVPRTAPKGGSLRTVRGGGK
ncbi:hypothetical protein EAI_03453, partial [Harpegnathos saltator]